MAEALEACAALGRQAGEAINRSRGVTVEVDTKPEEKTLPPRWVPGRPVAKATVTRALLDNSKQSRPPVTIVVTEQQRSPPPVVTMLAWPSEPPPLRTRRDHGCTPRYWDECDWATIQDDELEACGIQRPEGAGYRCRVPPPPAPWTPDTLQPVED